MGWYKHPGVLLMPLLLGAGVLRLWHLDQWLPEVYEEATPVVQALEFWGWRTGSFDLNPQFFNYPALTFYIHFVFQAAVLAVGLVGGQVASVEAFPQLLQTDYHWFVLLGRVVTMFFDVATVVVAFCLGRRLGNWQTGLLAAVLLACNRLHIELSQQVIVDVPLAFFSTLTLLFAIDAAADGKRIDFLKMGLGLGLAAATKYTAALLVVPAAAATLPHLVSKSQARMALWYLLLGLGLAGAVFLLCNPFLLTSFGTFLRDFSFEREHMALGHFGHDTQQAAALFYAHTLWDAMGLAGMAAAAALVHSVRQRDKFGGILFVWILFYLAVISTWNMRAERYLLPVLPALLVAAALGIKWVVGRRPSKGWRGVVLVVVLGFYGWPQALALKTHYARVSAPETRFQAKEWIEAHVPSEALVAMEHYTYSPGPASPPYWLVRIPLNPVHPQKVAGCYNYGWYENFDYILLSSFVNQRYRDKPEEFPVQMAFYRYIEQHWELAQRFAPGVGTGPEISIYRNPTTQRPDEPFDMRLYRSLDLGSVGEVQKYLNALGFALKGVGFEQRAWDVAQKIGLLERSKRGWGSRR